MTLCRSVKVKCPWYHVHSAAKSWYVNCLWHCRLHLQTTSWVTYCKRFLLKPHSSKELSFSMTVKDVDFNCKAPIVTSTTGLPRHLACTGTPELPWAGLPGHSPSELEELISVHGLDLAVLEELF